MKSKDERDKRDKEQKSILFLNEYFIAKKQPLCTINSHTYTEMK